MSTVAPTTDKLPIEDRKTIRLNRSEPYSAEEYALARAEQTERLETRYVQWDAPRPKNFKTPAGDTYRSAGRLYIRTCRDGIRRFTAYMHSDSLDHDFLYFDRVINDAKFGRMDGWERHTFENGDEGWIFDYPNYRTDHLEDFKPVRILDESTWAYPCDERLCREQYHEEDDGSHTLDSIQTQLTKRGGYEIEICKDMRDPNSEWYVNFWTTGDLTEVPPIKLATLANDLQWMGIECENTNNKARILRRNPTVTEELKERDQ